MRQFERRGKHVVEHRLGETTRESVLLARVVRTHQVHTACRLCSGRLLARRLRRSVGGHHQAMCELRARRNSEVLARRHVCEVSEAHHHPCLTQKCQLSREVRLATLALKRQRSIVRRCASHCNRHPRIVQLEAVVAMLRSGLTRQPRSVHRPEQPVTTPITGEHSTGSVCTVSARRQTKYDDACLWVAETGDWSSPVRLVAICSPFVARYRLAPTHESRAGATLLDFFANANQRVGGRTTSLIHGGRRYEPRG
ncbi:MAG: hypothetical protein RL352_484 [Actinomycetota bacterium]